MPRYNYQDIDDAGKLHRGAVFAFHVDEFPGIQ
jgi:hypothetical protein